MSAPDSRPALPIHLPFDSISPSFSKNSPCVFQVLGYYLTSLGEMPCGGLLCAYAGSAIRPLSSASVAVGQRRLQGFYKKKLDTNQDTHCIKIGVQLWRSGWDSNPRNLAVQLISSVVYHWQIYVWGRSFQAASSRGEKPGAARGCGRSDPFRPELI